MAARLWAAAHGVRDSASPPALQIDHIPRDELAIAEARAQAESSVWVSAWEAGALLGWEQAVGEATAWIDAALRDQW
jgi:hypothetical protein